MALGPTRNLAQWRISLQHSPAMTLASPLHESRRKCRRFAQLRNRPMQTLSEVICNGHSRQVPH
jgi:hypothetical protein